MKFYDSYEQPDVFITKTTVRISDYIAIEKKKKYFVELIRFKK